MRKKTEIPLPEKANKILNGILVVLLLIAIKVWHLAVVQHDKLEEESKRPQRRIVIERSDRAAIYDRFNQPLATNRVQYNAMVSYGSIRGMPRTAWKRDEEGRRVKCFVRKEYITLLAEKLAAELNMEAEWIEDTIHAKAAILGNVPCQIRQNITEQQYFRLKMLEKEWPGIHAEIAAQRCYPSGPVGGEIVGYIGPISRQEYDLITQEMTRLRGAVAAYEEGESELHLKGYSTIEEVQERLEELEKKAYHINDFVGKIGVEAACDESLKGCRGKHIYLADIRGNFLRELEGSEESQPGQRVILTLSAELQAFAQQLLAEYENEPASAVSHAMRPQIPDSQPWMKGGAIVAMDPNDGQIYALTSFPAFDPNDFIRCGSQEENKEKNIRVNQWLETEEYVAGIWDLKFSYSKQRFRGDYFEEGIEMGWDTFVNFILPKQSRVREMVKRRGSLGDALFVQEQAEKLVALFISPENSLTPGKILDLCFQNVADIPTGITHTLPEKMHFEERWEEVREEAEELKKLLSPYFAELFANYDKQLLLDLYRLGVDPSLFSPTLSTLLKEMPIIEHRDAAGRFVSVIEAIEGVVKEVFLETDFTNWRREHFSSYLAQKREWEEQGGRSMRPYIEYLDQARKEQFHLFWENNKWELAVRFLTGTFASQGELSPYQQALSHWEKEVRSGAHKGLEWVRHYHALRLRTDEMEPHLLMDFLKTLRPYSALNRPLIGRYVGLKGSTEQALALAFYPTYGFGYARSHAFRQAATIGSIFKLVPAYEALKQRYLTLKERGEALCDLNPLTIIDDKHRVWGKTENWNVGFTTEGRVIPMFYRGGRLPRSEHAGVGKVDLIRALEVSSNPYFAMLSGDILEDAEDLYLAANLFGFGEKTGIDLPGEYAGRLPKDIAYNRTGLYAMSIGQHSMVGTPLQTAVMLASIANGGKLLKPQIIKERVCGENREVSGAAVKWEIFLPPQIQNILLTGMKQVVMGDRGTARSVRQQFDPSLVKQVIGKTSTSEVIERVSLDGVHGQMKLKHVWFGAISYASNDFSTPELIVIVYLRYGGWGKDAAPLAVEIIKKWRELKRKYSS